MVQWFQAKQFAYIKEVITMYNILDNIELTILMLEKELENTKEESTKEWLKEEIKRKQEEYNKIEKQLIDLL